MHNHRLRQSQRLLEILCARVASAERSIPAPRRFRDTGAYSRFARAVAEAEQTRFIKPDLQADRFSWSVDEDAIVRAELFDCKLALLTNASDLRLVETVARYKSLSDNKRSFRALKSDIEIAPVHHRLPDRIQAMP